MLQQPLWYIALNSLFKKRRIVRPELRELALIQRVAYLLHKSVVKIQVVLNRKPSRKLFPRLEKVP